MDYTNVSSELLGRSEPADTREPIAIIGIGCRFPGGANDPQSYWKLLTEARDATCEVPPDRWDLETFYDPDPAKLGKLLTRRGGFLDHIDRFDAHFFGISPREAEVLDPQQRLLLEVAWESMEDGGIDPTQLAGQNVGVFVGAFTLDYKVLQFKSTEMVNSHTAVGSMMTILSARLSYIFDFRGPCVSMDTACSSSLVAVHMACQSIWNGECEMALAGGVNLMTSPEYTIAESKGGFLAHDGTSKAFDERANGYARGEGAGLILLKPLSTALADGDPIYALVRGSAINHDGRTNGITVPSPEAQVALMQAAYSRAGVLPGAVQYVEAHGTGTPVGDPIEARALSTVLSTGRLPGSKCLIGSCKTNIGHLEAAAGIAGLIKTALCLKYKQIPAHLHLQNPNPAIPFNEYCIRIPTSLEPWPAGDGPALAGVNSFGFGGTNAHIVLQAAPTVPADLHQQRPAAEFANAAADQTRPRLFPFSARSAEGLHAIAQTYRAYLADCSDEVLHSPDLLYSLAVRRSHHDHRLAIVAPPGSLGEHLDAFLNDEPSAYLSTGRRPVGQAVRVAFIFTGMGPQWWAMGRELYQDEPLFRQTLEECDHLFQQLAGWSVLKELLADEAVSRMEETEIAQPTNVMLQIGLTALWRSWGIEPEAIVGHSVGEITTAYVSGILSLEDTMKVAYHRSRLQQQATGKGTMMAVGMAAQEVEQLLAGYEGKVSIGAINSLASVTLSGDQHSLEELGKQLEEKQIFNRFLRVKIPYHSSQLDFMKAELLESLADLNPRTPTTRSYSTVFGGLIEERAFDASYWWRNVREPVRFADAIRQMIGEGYHLFIEVGPHPVLATSIAECLAHEGKNGLILPSLKRKEPERATLLNTLGAMYANGYPVAWERLYGDCGKFISLPAYPWQRERYWLESEESRQIRLGEREHPLLGRRLKSPQPQWESELNRRSLVYLDDHCIQGAVVYPGAAYVEMGLAAANRAFGASACMFEEIRFRRALFLPGTDSPRLQTLVNPEQALYDIYSRPLGEGQPWTHHASGRLRQLPSQGALKTINLPAIQSQCPEQLSKEACYQLFRQKGFFYGDCFQGIGQLWRGSYDSLAQIQLPESLEPGLATYHLHPVLLDNCFQALIAIGSFGKTNSAEEPDVFLPVGIDRIYYYRQPGARIWSHARIVEQNDRLVVGDIVLCDETGQILVEIQGFRAQSLATFQGAAAEKLDNLLYEIIWQAAPEVPAPTDAEKGRWLILCDQSGTGEALAEQIQAAGESYLLVRPAETYQISDAGHRATVNPEHVEDLALLLTEAAWGLPWHGIVHLWSLDSPHSPDTTLASLQETNRLGCLTVLNLIKALDRTGTSAPLWLVTRGAQPVTQNGLPVVVSQASMWGMGRVIGHQEHVGLWGGLVDLDPAAPVSDVALLFAELCANDGEDQIAFRDGQRYVARLMHSRTPTTSLPAQVRSDASYLITGGLGSLGKIIARWLIQAGARRLILTGRKQLPPQDCWNQESRFSEEIAAIREMQALGAVVDYAALDVANREQLAAFLKQHEELGDPPIRGIFHSAGVVQDQLLLQMSPETLDMVLRPKILGAWTLHQVFEQTPLDFFILFSSVSSVVAQTGQANYASGNAFLDALSYYRRSIGLPATSINWGPWAAGMILDLNLIEHYARRGMDSISIETGERLIGRLFSYGLAQVVVVSADWPLVLEYYARIPKFVAHLGQQENGASSQDGNGETFLTRLGKAVPAERLELIAGVMIELLARVLRIDPAKLDPQAPLNTLGLDSLIATELKNRMDVALGTAPTVVELLQGFSIHQLAEKLLPPLMVKVQEEITRNLLAADQEVSVESIQELAACADEDVLAQLLSELDGLSDEQVQELLGNQ